MPDVPPVCHENMEFKRVYTICRHGFREQTMALVNIDSVIRNLLQKLEKLSPPQGIELLSYKRNRSISVLVRGDNTFLVRERGYREEEQVVAKEDLQKQLKLLIKYEFPRSRKIRMYQIDTPMELEKVRKKL
jgi:hypothetical protein